MFSRRIRGGKKQRHNAAWLAAHSGCLCCSSYFWPVVLSVLRFFFEELLSVLRGCVKKGRAEREVLRSRDTCHGSLLHFSLVFFLFLFFSLLAYQ